MIFSNAVDKCSAELLKLRANRERLDGKSIFLESELSQLRSVTADELLDSILSEDDTQSQAGVRAAAIEIQLSDLGTAKAALIRRLQAAMVALGQARASIHRDRARKLQIKLDKLNADRLRVLEQLREIEGGGPSWIQEYFSRRGFLPLGAGAALGPVIAPTFEQLESEIRQLRAEAATIERQAEQHAAGGRYSAENLDELIVVCGAVDQIAPSDIEIRAWFEGAARAAAHAWVNSPQGASIGGEPDPLPARPLFTIVWENGALIAAESGYVHQEGRRPTSKDWMYGARPAAYAQASAAVQRGVTAA